MYFLLKHESRLHFPFCVPWGSLCNLVHKGVVMVHNFPYLIFSKLTATNMTLQTFSSMAEKKIIQTYHTSYLSRTPRTLSVENFLSCGEISDIEKFYMLPCMEFCRKICSIEIYAVLL